eukprot:UN00314
MGEFVCFHSQNMSYYFLMKHRLSMQISPKPFSSIMRYTAENQCILEKT